MTKPAGNEPNMKVKTNGIYMNIIFCVGSVGSGCIFICRNIVKPMMSGQMPRCRKWPNTGSTVGSNGISPNNVNTLVGSGTERSLIQPMNGAWRISSVIEN